ncbi:ATP-binding protein [Streptomyces peucetius]|uniref:ATP-binding protein n=1 Tax=Streptomyces peucetius TaxID=1950 RepID=A0ABY6I4D8_STRPE|nr:ATP-binding protein [Streptomyces peucetius]UYQ61846.1 ATP-binding protein [Streptomyces peucetius]
MNEDIPQYGMRFTAGAHSARHVRRIVRCCLILWKLRELTDAVELAVTELLANVVRHVPGGRCGLLILRHPQGVRVEVSDGSADLPVPQQAGPRDESGRGLALLDAVVDKWGVDLGDGDAPGKTVWFEVARMAGPPDLTDHE